MAPLGLVGGIEPHCGLEPGLLSSTPVVDSGSAVEVLSLSALRSFRCPRSFEKVGGVVNGGIRSGTRVLGSGADGSYGSSRSALPVAGSRDMGAVRFFAVSDTSR